MSENNSEKTKKGKGSPPSLAASVHSWRSLAHEWCEGYAADQEPWDDEDWDEWDALYGRVGQASRSLAAQLATKGLNVPSLNALAALCEKNAREWIDDDDRGDGKRLQAIAATERLLQACDPANAGMPQTPETPTIGRTRQRLQSPESIGFASDDDDTPRYADPEEFAGKQVRIFVQGADGKHHSGFFKDGRHENRWHGPPEPNRQEDMVCHGDLQTAQWFLIQYVLPRKVTGAAANDSFVDMASVACLSTPIQALHWFSDKAFGPPPQLLERVRRFAADWERFRASDSARELLKTLIERNSVSDDDPLLCGSARDDLHLLRRLELAHVANSDSFFPNSIAQDMGVEPFMVWVDAHLAKVVHLLPTPLIQNAAQSGLAVAAGSGNRRQSRQRPARPSAQVVDAAAKGCLEDALKAAECAGQSYLPGRGALAAAVSKILNYALSVPSLFGTTQRRGQRHPRHPGFMDLWKRAQQFRRDAKRRHETRE